MRSRFSRLEPDLMLAAAAIGVSHLLQSGALLIWHRAGFAALSAFAPAFIIERLT